METGGRATKKAKTASSRQFSSAHHAPTVRQIIGDALTQLSLDYWAPKSTRKLKPFDAQIVEDIYYKELGPKSYSISRVMLLELSLYLEKYVLLLLLLWLLLFLCRVVLCCSCCSCCSSCCVVVVVVELSVVVVVAVVVLCCCCCCVELIVLLLLFVLLSL